MPNPSNIDDANLTASGFTTEDDRDAQQPRVLLRTAAQIASPSIADLANLVDIFRGPDKTRYYSSSSALVPMDGSGGAPAGYTPVTGTTHTWAPGTKLYCTNASGCTITIPDGLSEGDAGVAIQGTGGGPLTVTGSALIPSGTLSTSQVGQVIAWERTDSSVANQCVVTGNTPAGPKFLGYFADWPAVVAAYPVGGAEIAALTLGDYLVCTGGNGEKGLTFTPNAAKTRLIAQSRRVQLISLGGTLANPIVAAITATGLVTFSGGLPTVPAYMIQPGDYLEVTMLIRHTGTAGGTEVQLKLGTANSASDQTIAKTSTNNTNNQDAGALQTVYVYDTTTVGAMQTTILNSQSTSVQNTPSPLAFNSLQYFNVNTQTWTTPDTILLTQLRVILVQKQ